MTTIIDSCVIIDVTSSDKFTESSKKALVERAKVGRLIAPDIVFAEVCVAFPSAQETNRVFSELNIDIVPMDRETLYLASQRFQQFNKRNKRTQRLQIRSQKRILPDFYIGSLASCEGLPLLTRDLRRKWHLDFPKIQIITP